MGGYHWSEIVIARPLIFTFAFAGDAGPGRSASTSSSSSRGRTRCCSLLPAPGPRRALRGAGALPGGALGGDALALDHRRGRRRPRRRHARRGDSAAGCWPRGSSSGSRSATSATRSRSSASASPASIYSYRRARNRLERNQVRWILLASLLSSALIGYLMLHDPGGHRDARARQRRLADVRRLAALHVGLRVQHHPIQADAGRGVLPPERPLPAGQRRARRAVLGRAGRRGPGGRLHAPGRPDLAGGDRGDGRRPW